MFEFIQKNTKSYSVAIMSQVLDVSRSGYYAWLKRPPSARDQADQDALEDIKQLYTHSKGRLGQRKLWERLRALGKKWGRGRVARLMRAHGLKGKKKRPFRPTTTDSAHTLAVAPNLLEQDFTAQAPNQKWTSDITYI